MATAAKKSSSNNIITAEATSKGKPGAEIVHLEGESTSKRTIKIDLLYAAHISVPP
jgi:hypothetical protein